MPTVNERCEKIKTSLQKASDAVKLLLDRRYNFAFAIKHKKDADAPLFRAEFSGEIPKEWVALLAFVGFITLLFKR